MVFSTGALMANKSKKPSKPSGKGGYWLTTGHIAELLGCVQSTVYGMIRDGLLNEAELTLGRTNVFDRAETVAHLRQKGYIFKVEPMKLGMPKPKFDPENDEILTIWEVMEILDYNSRSEFQMGISSGIYPPPDFYYEKPFPSFWLRSSVYKWLDREKPLLSYHTLEKGVFQVEYARETIGIVRKRIEGTDMVRDRETLKLKEVPRVRWTIDGVDKVFKTRKIAAQNLIKLAKARRSDAPTNN